MNRLRLFTAVALPEPVVDELARRATLFTESIPAGTLRAVKPRNYHITLQFLGDTDAPFVPAISAEIDAAVASQENRSALELQLDAIGAFPNARRPRTVWAGITDPTGRLTRLAAVLARRLAASGYEFDGKPFRPHVTIGYMRRQATKDGIRAITTSLAKQDRSSEYRFDIGEIRLVSSVTGAGGSRYETVHTTTLGDV